MYFNADCLQDVFASAFWKGNLKLIDTQTQHSRLLIGLVVVNNYILRHKKLLALCYTARTSNLIYPLIVIKNFIFSLN